MNKYEVISVVGEGAYGVVLKCRNKETGDFVAIKKFKESEDDDIVRKTTLREVKILRMLKTNNIVSLKEAFRRKGKLYLVFEFVQKNLLEVLEEHHGGLPAEDVRRYVFQLCVAIEWCHRNNVIHRDIKPENLLITSSKILKLCDFGFARQMPNAAAGEPTALTDYVATRWYRAPELLLGSSEYSFAVDQWAIGCIMGELTDGNPLFPGDTEVDQLYIIQQCLGPLTSSQMEMFLKNPRFAGLKFPEMKRGQTIHQKYGDRLSKVALHFMRSLLYMDPGKRLTSRECLDHAWFSGLKDEYNICDLEPCATTKDLGWSLVGGSAPTMPPQAPSPIPPPTATAVNNREYLSKQADVPEMLDESCTPSSSPYRGNDAESVQEYAQVNVPVPEQPGNWKAFENSINDIAHMAPDHGLKARLLAMEASRPDADNNFMVMQRPGGDEYDSASVLISKDALRNPGELHRVAVSHGMQSNLFPLQAGKTKSVVPQQLAPGGKLMRKMSPLQPTLLQLTAERPSSRGSGAKAAPSNAQRVGGGTSVLSNKSGARYTDGKEAPEDWEGVADWESKIDASDTKVVDASDAAKSMSNNVAAGKVRMPAAQTQPQQQTGASKDKPRTQAAPVVKMSSTVTQQRSIPLQQTTTQPRDRDTNSRAGPRVLKPKADETADKLRADADASRSQRTSVATGLPPNPSPKNDYAGKSEYNSGASTKPAAPQARAKLVQDAKKPLGMAAYAASRALERSEAKEADVPEEIARYDAHETWEATATSLSRTPSANPQRPTSQGNVGAVSGTVKWAKRTIVGASNAVTMPIPTHTSTLSPRAPVAGAGGTTHTHYSLTTSTAAHAEAAYVSHGAGLTVSRASNPAGTTGTGLSHQATRVRTLGLTSQPQRAAVVSWGR